MDKNTLLLFIQRIMASGSNERSKVIMEQLLAILIAQNADDELVELVKNVIYALPEVKEAARTSSLSEQVLAEAGERARRRKEYERLAALRGRC